MRARALPHRGRAGAGVAETERRPSVQERAPRVQPLPRANVPEQRRGQSRGAEDVEVYTFARRLNCARMRASGIVAAADCEVFSRHVRLACSGTGDAAGVGAEDVVTERELCRQAG